MQVRRTRTATSCHECRRPIPAGARIFRESPRALAPVFCSVAHAATGIARAARRGVPR